MSIFHLLAHDCRCWMMWMLWTTPSPLRAQIRWRRHKRTFSCMAAWSHWCWWCYGLFWQPQQRCSPRATSPCGSSSPSFGAVWQQLFALFCPCGRPEGFWQTSLAMCFFVAVLTSQSRGFLTRLQMIWGLSQMIQKSCQSFRSKWWSMARSLSMMTALMGMSAFQQPLCWQPNLSFSWLANHLSSILISTDLSKRPDWGTSGMQ